MSDEIEGAIALGAAVVGTVGFFFARWNETNPDKPWYVRLAKVLDLSQVFDSTRKLGD